MSGSGMRRKIRKRRSRVQNSRMRIAVLGAIILSAIFLGFLTARFVIGPLIGYNADESRVELKQDSTIEGEQEKQSKDKEEQGAAAANTGGNAQAGSDTQTETAPDSEMPQEGYALQFGAFSTKEAAEKLAEALRLKGIETRIIQTKDAFKVISPVLADRTAALKALEESKEKDAEEVFITSFSQ